MYDYIIVGGGISGLYMYYRLMESGKKIILLEKLQVFGGRIYQKKEKFDNHLYSFPAGAARFNKNHHRVIQLLKEFHLLDFRKDKGLGTHLKFIDSKEEFSKKFQNKTGFDYIEQVLKCAEQYKEYDLHRYTFQEFANKCLHKDEVDFLLIASGYSGQLKKMNMKDAYHLFSSGINNKDTFYAGYYHELIDSMVKYIKKRKGNLHLDAQVDFFDYDCDKEHYVVQYDKKEILGKKLFLCVPQKSLLEFPFLKDLHPKLKQTIGCKKLCRTYALFDKEDIWFHDLKDKVITNNPLRYIIPIDNKNGLIMISYSDDSYCNYWNNMRNDQDKLKRTIVKHVRETFHIDIERPKKVWVFYWDCGVAYWKKDIDSEKEANYIVNPSKDLYICGENYSLDQSWVEGALESCDRCLEKVQC